MILFLTVLLTITSSFASVVQVSGPDLERGLNDAIENAVGETEIELAAGTYYFQNELLITKPGIRIRGQGASETILSFKKQKAGAQGVLATRDRFRIENLTVEDTAGNGIKVIGANNVQIIGVRVRWTKKLSPENGAYGVYPVLSKNILIENCEVSDSSDAGIYVGQSVGIVVRGNEAHHNVAGIEIENSDDADVTGNRAHDNTAGILVFNLPDLVKKDGKGTYIHDNEIFDNNGKNFSTKGSIINLVPKGLGYFSLASQRTEIAHNRFRNHSLSHLAVSNYFVSERHVKDPTYDPMPKGVSIHSNDFDASRLTLPDGSRINFIIKFVAGPMSHDIIYDGIDDGTYGGKKPLPNDRICIGKNKKEGKFRFANIHLDYDRPHFPLPGTLTRDLSDHNCELAPVRPMAIDLNAGVVDDVSRPDAAEIEAACGAPGEGVNVGALNYDCPKLSDYRLEGGLNYKLSNELFTDYALKDRFIYLPAGGAIDYKPEFPMAFPVGTVIAKNFSLKDATTGKVRMIETRLLIHRAKGWAPLNYLWKNDRTALLERSGMVFAAKVETPSKESVAIDYHVPSLRQCASCHSINGAITPIGPRAKFLNVDDQLERWARAGHLRNLPDMAEVTKLPVWSDESAPLDLRAKAYLEINCAHCHNPVGNARNTGLFFSTNRDSTSIEMGHCKTPVAAGFATGGNIFDVTPGESSKSILSFRIGQNHLAIKMPQLGRSVSHKEGNNLINRWIDGMKKGACK